MLWQLAWQMHRWETSERKNAEMAHLIYRAPTFSWASVVGRVVWPEPEKPKRQYADIVEAYCKLKGQNRFGEVTDGHLSLRGRILEARLTCENSGLGIQLSTQEPLDLRVIQDASPEDKHLTKTPICSGEMIQRGRSFHWSRSPVNNSAVKVCCLRLFESRSFDTWLILVESSRVSGAFERVGIASCRIVADGDDESTEDRGKYERLASLWDAAPEQEITIV